MNKQKKSYLPLWRCLLPAGWYTVIFRFSAQNATVSGSLSDRLLYRLLHAVSGAFRALTAEGQTAVVEFLSYYERKGAHMFLYFVLMGLLLFALRPWLTSAPKRAAAAIAVCTVLAEYLRGRFPGLTVTKSASHREVIQYYIEGD